MTTLLWVSLGLAAIAVSLCIAALVVLPMRAVRARGVVEVVEVDEGRIAIRTPYGRGSARLVVHDDRGRVYEITLDLRGERGPTITYVPPALAMVRSHVAQRVAALNPPQEPQ